MVGIIEYIDSLSRYYIYDSNKRLIISLSLEYRYDWLVHYGSFEIPPRELEIHVTIADQAFHCQLTK